MFRKKRFYKTKEEALKNRKKGETIWYDLNQGYYLIRPKKRKLI